MQRASNYHLEIFAITQAVSKWRKYLLGRRFTILTDQQSPKNLTTQTIQTPEQKKWLTKLVGYDFRILYKRRKKNQAADALSRQPDASFLDLSVQTFALEHEIKALNQSHLDLLAILNKFSLQSFLSRLAMFFVKDCSFVVVDWLFRMTLLYANIYYLSFTPVLQVDMLGQLVPTIVWHQIFLETHAMGCSDLCSFLPSLPVN